MNGRTSRIASLLARTYGWRVPAGALALSGAFAAWGQPLAGTTAAALLLLARAMHVAARADDERRALICEIEHLQTALRTARHDNATRETELIHAQHEAAEAARAAALDEHARALQLAQSTIAPYAQALSDRLDADADCTLAWIRPLRDAAHTLAIVAHGALDPIPPAQREIVFDEAAVDLREMIDAVVLLVAPRAARKQSQLRVFIDRSVAACVLGDRARLGEALLNLLAYTIDAASTGVVALAARAESLNAGAQRVVISINGAPPATHDAPARGSRAFLPINEPADAHQHPGLVQARLIAHKMGGDITILEGRSVGVCVALHAPFTIERHDWPVPEHERRWAVVDVGPYEDRQPICELLKKLGITTLPSDAKPPVYIDFRFVEAGQPPSPHGARRTIVVTRDALPGGMRERSGVTELSLTPLSWTALGRICNPRAGTPVMRSVVPARPQSRPSAGQPVVLITDDNAVNLKVLARQLDVLGCRCIVASSGHEALDVLGHEAVDLLITDLQMPGMNGVELARHVYATFADTGRTLPMILLSANSDVKLADADRALFGAILVKTSGLDALDAALRRLLPATAQRRAAPLERYDFSTLDSLAAQGVDVDGLLRDWRHAMESDLADLHRHYEVRDEEGVRRALHKLAGAVGIVGNHGLMHALQRASAAQHSVDSALLEGLVARIRAQMHELDARGSRR